LAQAIIAGGYEKLAFLLLKSCHNAAPSDKIRGVASSGRRGLPRPIRPGHHRRTSLPDSGASRT
jgi:hypothetical protein